MVCVNGQFGYVLAVFKSCFGRRVLQLGCYAGIAAVTLAVQARAVVVDSVWPGGEGAWYSTQISFSPPISNNDGETTYNAFLDGGKTNTSSLVWLNGDATIGSLTIDQGDSLRFLNGTVLSIAGLANSGLIEANGLYGALVSRSGSLAVANNGTIQASGNGTLTLSTGAFDNSNGLIEALDGSYVKLSGGATISGGRFSTAGTGALQVTSDDSAILAGTITNNGTVQVHGYYATSLNISGATTLTGNGIVRMSDYASQMGSTDAGAALTNDVNHTIAGSGQLGNGTMGITNKGTILGDQFHALVVNPGSNGLTNLGVMRSSGNGTLTLSTGAFDNSNGLIEALDGSYVKLSGGATISGGTFSTTGTGALQVTSSDSAILAGTITNNGTVQVHGYYATSLNISGATTLTGNGIVRMSDYASQMGGTDAGAALTNDVNHTIAGSGQLGNGTMGITNRGAILGDQAHALVVNPGLNGLTNMGVMRSSGNGTLTLSTGVFDNTNGLIEALDESRVTLSGGATISGGSFSTAGTGALQVVAGDSAILAGTITNNGTVQVHGYLATSLNISGATTLTGNGIVRMSDSASQMGGADAGAALTNDVNHTIAGSGQLGNGTMGITNRGTILGDQAHALVVNPGSNGLTNLGVMRSSGNGTLTLSTGVFDNTNGLIEALDGSRVTLSGGATVSGGMFATTGTGALQVVAGDSAILAGTITNDGTVQVHGYYATSLNISGATTMTGNGIVRMSDYASRMGGADAGAALTNDVNHTIAGSGQLGNGTMGITNKGTILGDQFHALVVNPGSNGLTNLGVLRAATGGTLEMATSQFESAGTVAAEGGGIVVVDGNYSQTAAAALNFEILGSEDGHSHSGYMHVLGDASLFGSMTVEFDGYSPVAGDSWTLLYSDGLLSRHDLTRQILGLAPGFRVNEVFTDHMYQLTVTAVPEPSAAAMLIALGGAALLGCLRQRSRVS